MKNRIIFWVLAAVAVIAGFLLFKPASAPVPDEEVGKEEAMEFKAITPNPNLDGEVVLGAVFPLTGNGAAYGLPIQKATELAVEEINAVSGVGGKKMVIRYEDGKCDGKEGLTAAQKLVNVDNVQVIFGGVCSSEVLGMADLVNEKKRVVISPSATSPDITKLGGNYVFRFAPSDALASTVAGRYAVEQVKAKRAAVLSENTDYPQGLRRGFKVEYETQGGRVVLDETWNTGTSDFRTLALKVKNADVDVIYIVPQTPAPGITLLQALKDQGVTATILTAEVLIGRDVAKDNAVLMEGVYGFEAAYNEQGSRAITFANAYKARYGEELAFPFFMANAYSAVYRMKELVEAVGNDGALLVSELARTKDWSGGALDGVSLDSHGDIQWKTYSVKLIKGGEVTETGIFEL